MDLGESGPVDDRSTAEAEDVVDEVAIGRISRQVIHSGRIIDLSIDTVRFPDGSEGKLEFVTHRGASAVLPF